jgi:hypothetical protein
MYPLLLTVCAENCTMVDPSGKQIPFYRGNGAETAFQERTLAHARLVKNKAGESESGVAFKWEQVWECARDPQIYFLVLTTLLKSSASGGKKTPCGRWLWL